MPIDAHLHVGIVFSLHRVLLFTVSICGAFDVHKACFLQPNTDFRAK